MATNYITTYQNWDNWKRAVIIETHSKSCIIVEYASYDFDPIPIIWNLYVPEQYRNQGIATDLLRQAEEIATDWGFTQVKLWWSDADTPTAILDWYKRNGYRQERITHDIRGHKEIMLIKQL